MHSSMHFRSLKKKTKSEKCFIHSLKKIIWSIHSCITIQEIKKKRKKIHRNKIK